MKSWFCAKKNLEEKNILFQQSSICQYLLTIHYKCSCFPIYVLGSLTYHFLGYHFSLCSTHLLILKSHRNNLIGFCLLISRTMHWSPELNHLFQKNFFYWIGPPIQPKVVMSVYLWQFKTPTSWCPGDFWSKLVSLILACDDTIFLFRFQ